MIKLPTKIYIDKSPVHGWGVFASEVIKKDELIEEVPFMILFNKGEESHGSNHSMLYDYRFSFPGNSLEWKYQVIPFGCGCIYNHSDNNNAYWITDEETNTLKFYSNRNIEPNEEIFTYYGPLFYWNSRDHVKVV